ncbi:Tata Element Modulatory Factor [Manis pentadactyla]|nr:Tata Element Modulatory Factor [Manis pentadactyla]
MSWFNASQLSSFAKQALSQAQKSIDRVLDIQEEEPSAWAETIPNKSSDVQTIQKSPVVSTPPAKSQRPEEVKNTLQESLHTGQSRTGETTESKVKDPSPCVSGEGLALESLSPKTEGRHEETVNKESDMQVSVMPLKVSESAINVKTTRKNISNNMSTSNMSTQSLTTETKDMALEPKEQKHEDRQSNTPPPPVSTFSSDAFERTDSFSVQSLDSRSVSEINSDDELSGKGYALVPIVVNPSTPKTKIVESVEGKSEEADETLIIPTEETEMEESRQSATPVNCEQPDTLVSSPINEGHTVLDKETKQCEGAESQPEALSEKEDVCKKVEFLNEKLVKREAQL